MAGVYQGLNVLELGSGFAGPMTAMFLADNGAQVTRIEPRSGEAGSDLSGLRVWNRGKRSAWLDIEAHDDRDAFLALARTADIVVSTLSLADADRLRLDHASLSRHNPRLISVSITGYGAHLSHRDRPAIDALVAARTGLLYDQKGRVGTAMEYIGGRRGPEPDFGLPEDLRRGADRPGPVFPRSTWPSIGATYVASLGIAAALRAREVTGQGQLVETSLLQGALTATCLNWQHVENPDAPLYWMWPVDARSIEGLYECADGRWVHHWTVRPNWVLEGAAGEELSPPDPDGAYRDDPDRVSMEPDGMIVGSYLHPLLTEAFKKFPSEAWVRAAESAGMGVAAVRSPAEALLDDSFLADGCVVRVDDPEVGPIRHAGPLLEFSACPSAVRGPAPRSGEHTDAVLAEAVAAASVVHAPAGSGVELDQALGGIRVIDLGLGVAGPFTGRMLADLGADVIKVHAMHDTYWAGTHMGLGTNRGKRSIAINLKHPDGRAVLDRLIERADVVATNWRPGATARLGLDYETLHERYQSLIVCNTRGFETGPRSHLPGTDQTAAALTGAEWEDGGCDAGNPPMWSRSNMGDTGNALLAATAITAALYHRERTGEGQAVSTSIVNAGLLHTSYAWIREDGTPGGWTHVDGDQYGLSPYHRMFRCADDRWIFVVAAGDDVRTRLLGVIGEEVSDGLDDPAKVAALFEERFLRDDAAAWIDQLDRADVPAEIINETFCRALFDDPEARSRRLVSETWAAGVGRFEDPGILVDLSDTPAAVQRGPSQCGEHTRELLLEYGYTDEEADALALDRAVLDAPVVRP